MDCLNSEACCYQFKQCLIFPLIHTTRKTNQESISPGGYFGFGFGVSSIVCVTSVAVTVWCVKRRRNSQPREAVQISPDDDARTSDDDVTGIADIQL